MNRELYEEMLKDLKGSKDSTARAIGVAIIGLDILFDIKENIETVAELLSEKSPTPEGEREN